LYSGKAQEEDMLRAENDHPERTLHLKTSILLTSVHEARLKHIVSLLLYIGNFESIIISITAKVYCRTRNEQQSCRHVYMFSIG
jgi:hypothetical protein